MPDCTCPFTLESGYFEMLDHVPECPVHGSVAPKKWKDIYEERGICPICKDWHRIGKRGSCGKG